MARSKAKFDQTFKGKEVSFPWTIDRSIRLSTPLSLSPLPSPRNQTTSVVVVSRTKRRRGDRLAPSFSAQETPAASRAFESEQRLYVYESVSVFDSPAIEYLIQNRGGEKKNFAQSMFNQSTESRLIAPLVTRGREEEGGRRAFSSSVGLQIDSRARQIEARVVYPPFTIYRSACTPLATPTANFPSWKDTLHEFG